MFIEKMKFSVRVLAVGVDFSGVLWYNGGIRNESERAYEYIRKTK